MSANTLSQFVCLSAWLGACEKQTAAYIQYAKGASEYATRFFRCSRLLIWLGAIEARTEPCIKYGEGVLEMATTPGDKSNLGSGGSADNAKIAARILE